MSGTSVNMRNGSLVSLVVVALLALYHLFGGHGTPGNDLGALERRISVLEASIDRKNLELESAKLISSHVIDVVKDDLKASYGLAEQGELLIKIADEVKRLRKVQAGALKRARSARSGVGGAPGAHGLAAAAQTLSRPGEPPDGLKPPNAGPNLPQLPPVCVTNPAVHYEKTGEIARECPPKPLLDVDPSKGWPYRAYVITINKNAPGIKARQRYLGKQGLRLDIHNGVDGNKQYGREYDFIFDEAVSQNITYNRNPKTGALTLKGQPGFLTAGERGYRAGMRKLFSSLIAQNVTGNVVVLDDDVLLRCDFHQRLKELLEKSRCGNHVALTSAQPGVLMLGSSIWINGTFPARGAYTAGWNLTDYELKTLKDAGHDPPGCYNVHKKVFGSFAVMYHSALFQSIVDWLDDKYNARPFDHIFPDLVGKGYIVRSAYPYLAVQDVRHTSNIDPSRQQQSNMQYRAKLHRWGALDVYCDPETELPITT